MLSFCLSLSLETPNQSESKEPSRLGAVFRRISALSQKYGCLFGTSSELEIVLKHQRAANGGSDPSS